MALNYTTALITGAAGFIGYHLSERLLAEGHEVVGIDNLNDYYDVNLKKARLERLQQQARFSFHQVDIADLKGLRRVFDDQPVEVAVNLAAQAGVRYSLENPHAYVEANLVGFVNMLECARAHRLKHFVFASSSSVYGANTKMPFSVHDNVDHPVSLYAASKKSNELIAHTYSHLFDLPCTGLRFFTVYGPWGRPDMALFLFTDAIINDRPIKVFNHGKMRRDFTYIDDIVEGVKRVIEKVPQGNRDWRGDAPDPGTSYAKYKIYNIGNNQPVELMDYIGAIETALDKNAEKEFLDLQPGDVPATYADVGDLVADVGFKPQTDVGSGVARFVEWYRDYYGK